MRTSAKFAAAFSLALAGVAGAPAESASAAPLPVAAADVITPASGVTEARYAGRRTYRVYRHGGYRTGYRRAAIAPLAILGAFGSILGGAIASSRYDNYYGPYGYGYAGYPYGYGYGYAPVYSYGYGSGFDPYFNDAGYGYGYGGYAPGYGFARPVYVGRPWRGAYRYGHRRFR